jgi:hypothetical protein
MAVPSVISSLPQGTLLLVLPSTPRLGGSRVVHEEDRAARTRSGQWTACLLLLTPAGRAMCRRRNAALQAVEKQLARGAISWSMLSRRLLGCRLVAGDSGRTWWRVRVVAERHLLGLASLAGTACRCGCPLVSFSSSSATYMRGRPSYSCRLVRGLANMGNLNRPGFDGGQLV